MAKSERARLSRLGVLAPAALSACMDASVLAVPAAGAIVSTVLKELSRAFMLKKWYHGDLTAKEAEYLMMRCGKNGSFLVRESKGSPGDYVLSVRAHNQVSHVIIKKQNNKYNVGSGEEFDDLASLVEHFRRYPMIESSGTVLRLLQPISGTKIRLMNNDPKIETSPPGINSGNKMISRIGDEFYSLQEYDNKQLFTTKEATKPRNALKNRYKNVLPFDQTRVVLRRMQADVNSDEGDYINASYIRPRAVLEDTATSHSSTESLTTVHSLNVAKSEKALDKKMYLEPIRCANVNNNYIETTTPEKLYIATQGCLKETIEDFWEMIWQEEVGLIVMITKETEKEKKKCEQYWPDQGNSLKMRYLKVTTKMVTHKDDYIMREFQLEDNNKCNLVYQYQYTNWPDHSAPNNTESILEFVDEVNSAFKKDTIKTLDKRVICVHCSAGVGRTGTFIVLDMLMDKMKQNGKVELPDIYEMVKLVRSQRAGLVQNEAQYKFLYHAIQWYNKRYN